VEKGQTIQWPQNTKGISRICKWKKDRQFNGQDMSLVSSNRSYVTEIYKVEHVFLSKCVYYQLVYEDRQLISIQMVIEYI
jgi:hypothetical protein